MPPSDPPHAAPADESAPAEASSALDDEEIFCPICGYNLTGNMTGRCSECGSLFDRKQLFEATRIATDALMPWERPDEFSLFDRFWQTLRISFVQPKRFALAFAVQPARSRSTSFYIICLLLLTANAVMIGLARCLVSPIRPPDITLLAALPLFLVLPIVLMNFAVGLTYTALYRHADHRRHLRPWRAILEYATAHWLLGAAAPVMALLFATVNWTMLELLLMACTFSVWVGCSILWACTLVEVIRWRTATGKGPTRGLGLTLVLAWAAWPATVAALVAIATTLSWLYKMF